MKITKGVIHEIVKPFVVTNGGKFRLKDVDPSDTRHLDSSDKDEAREMLQDGIDILSDMQQMLYAQDRWSVLLIFQAMDAAGKDGTIRHVMSGINPQGCQVYSFKAPSMEELDHDFMWRAFKALPERGRIGIFNRSYYEEVLVVRVHPELLERQKIPQSLVSENIWKERYEDIVSFERYLHRNGYIIRKFFLHVSPEEQKERFISRLDEPEKHWKFSLADVGERKHWKRYMNAYEEMIRNTATEFAPWCVVPADSKWFTRLVVAGAIVDALSELDLHFPEIDSDKRKQLAEARKLLEEE